MTDREQYTPGPASGAQVRKDGEKKWTLILVRELRHSPEKIWQALTDPAHLREWAPFDVNGSLDTVGTVKLTWAGTPTPLETRVTRADAPKVLEYGDIRWELESFSGGTRLTLWHTIDRRFISMSAAGWHIAFDVLDRLLIGTPIGRIVAGEAMKFGWPRLNSEYAQQFGIETPSLRLRKQAQEYEEAKQIQQALMPKEIPQLPGLEISGSWQPARIVGGDYFDVFKFGGSRLGLCIADVSGKGMPAALLMSNLQAVVKALATENRSPKELLEKVNRVMWHNTKEDKFITMFYGLLDIERKTLQYTSAGHNPPVLTREDGAQVRLEQGGLIVGAFEDCVYDQGEIDLRPGDRLVIFTDGLSEAMDGKGEEFGEKRLAEAACCNRQLSAEALHRSLLDRVTDFCGGEFGDDATVLVVAVS
jgi:Stage II sporulation protein E (SpoIIE)/Activator of Hsp90 ATPase homolog 1-like protein